MRTNQSYPATTAQTANLRFLFSCLVGLLLIFGWPTTVSAHPLGNFTVNRYSRLELGEQQATLLYIIDMAEIPTQQEIAIVDSNRDGKMSEPETTAYLAELAKSLQVNLHLLLDNKQVDWQLLDKTLEFPPGQADLPTLRLTMHLVADLPGQSAAWSAEYLDDNYEGRLGWQEVIVRALPGIALVESDAPTEDVTNELRSYPESLLQSPTQVNRARFRFAPQAGSVGSTTTATQSNAPLVNVPAGMAKPTDRFAELINIPTLGPMAILLALLAAFGWGAAHAFTPGHGKTVVAAYLVGSRGTVAHALFLGLTTTITHTAGVFALGMITLFASQYILPETLFPWLELASGLLVVLIGISLAWGRLRGLLGLGNPDHDHSHAHSHDHEHGHDHSHGHSHSHLPPGADGQPMTWTGLLALGISGGLLPCPSALVLMLGAIALNRVAFGLLLILVFSVGLASVLTAIGIVLVHAGKLFERLPEGGGPVLRYAPVASAIFITLVGLGISWQALVQTGVL